MTRQKNKIGDIETWDQTESPEVPDRGGSIKHRRPPFGGGGTRQKNKRRGLEERNKGIKLTTLRFKRGETS